jgi:chemotaxis-related protein WspB
MKAVEELPESFDAVVGVVGFVRLGLPLRYVQEVVPRVPLIPLPEAPKCVAGCMLWRGAYVPVVDMGLCWSGQPLPERLEDRIVVVRHGASEPRGLLFSDVDGIAPVEKSRLAPVRAEACRAAGALGFLELDGQPLLLVALGRLLDPLRGLRVPESLSPCA